MNEHLQGKNIMDVMELADDRQAIRIRESRRVEKAIQRTRKLLASDASADPVLQQTWSKRLLRQEKQLNRLCQ
jgi:hypothetical protein